MADQKQLTLFFNNLIVLRLNKFKKKYFSDGIYIVTLNKKNFSKIHEYSKS